MTVIVWLEIDTFAVSVAAEATGACRSVKPMDAAISGRNLFMTALPVMNSAPLSPKNRCQFIDAEHNLQADRLRSENQLASI